MNKKVFLILIIISAFLFESNLNAQDRVINGVVTTSDSILLIDVKIQVKSSKHVVFSNSSGNFAVNCKASDKLKISADGFYPQKIKITDATAFTTIKLNMKSGMENFDKAIAYVNPLDIDKLKLKLSNKNDIDFSHYDTVFDLVIGKLTGVTVVNGGFQMRGTRSISGSNLALVLVDGVPIDNSELSTISPTQVKSIRVLSGGDVAIWGSEAGNGVISIKTKRGN